MSEMKVTAIAPWFGGKRNMASLIVAELGPHAAYWEPFCGGMAVLLAKPQSASETVNDFHADLINLARCIRDEKIGPALYRRLRRELSSEAEFKECRIRCNSYPIACEELDPNRAHDYFLLSWQGMNGLAGTHRYNLTFSRRLTKDGGAPAKRFSSVVDSIPAFRRRLKNVAILSTCGIDLCEKIEDADGVVIYADPPYFDKGAKYQHDFKSEDHLRLAAALNRFNRARVVVSYYAHPLLSELYPRWTVRDCARTKSMVSQGRRQKNNEVIAPEVLLINGPSFAVESDHLFGAAAAVV